MPLKLTWAIGFTALKKGVLLRFRPFNRWFSPSSSWRVLYPLVCLVWWVFLCLSGWFVVPFLVKSAIYGLVWLFCVVVVYATLLFELLHLIVSGLLSGLGVK